uniref:Mitochondrial import inner membrane translocase subunit TIM22 n=1 Tax=Aureoumbra lagunensis TaxID=44058 RepID=A0A7S3K385_9STRA|mmetsp:Transcript_19069/g.24724  ORF Transcript_19069/g.24724 Transcript_19069/m.24724 type:complete len:129 (+) Transcript_19069:85-471(+)
MSKKEPGILTYAVFGGICGSLTGLTMGVVDAGMQMQREGSFDMSRGLRLGVNEMARSSILMGGFFTAYQTIKYILYHTAGFKDVQALVGATTTISLAPFALLPPLRRYIPFGGMLIAVDFYHSHLRKR